MGEPNDEISLRELYLILRRGWRLISLVSVGVAAVALAFMLLLPTRFEATASVRVAPLKVQGQTLQNGQVQNDIVDVNSVTQVGFDAYRTIALSNDVLSAALKAVPNTPAGLTAKQLAASATVTKVSGASGEPLILAQSVTWGVPAQAAALANAWAQASATAVQATVGRSLGHVRTTLDDQLGSLSTALDKAEATWAAFQKQDARTSLQAQLDALDTRTTTAQQQLDELDRQIATAKAQQALLQGVIDARGQGSAAGLDAQMQALSAQGVLPSGLARQLSDALASVPGGPGLADQDLATLVARAQLQQQAADLAGYVAERSTIVDQLDGFAHQASVLRDQLASQQQTAQRLQRQLDTATQAYDQVAQAAPLVDVADKLVPSMAGVFSSASVPASPQPRRTAVVTAVAFILALFATVLFVFLRAAVADEPGRPASGGTATPGGARAAPQSSELPLGTSDVAQRSPTMYESTSVADVDATEEASVHPTSVGSAGPQS